MTNLLVSVIVPVYNGEKFIAAALESLRTQTYKPIELIVVDDGSTDRTAEIVKHFPEATLVRQENLGVSAARNIGVSHCTGEFIAFLDSDDCWEPPKTQLQVDYLNTHPEVGFVLCSERIFIEPGVERPSWLVSPKMLERHALAATCTLMVRRDAFLTVGQFDTAYRIGEDTDWLIRAIELGVGMGVVEEATILRRIHGENATYDMQELEKSRLRILHASVLRKRKKQNAREHDSST